MENPYLESHMAVAAGYPEPRDTRPIAGPWQREKSVKMMKSLKGRPRSQVSLLAGQLPAKPSDRPCAAMVNADPAH
jgi:hypothetical protein